LNWKKYYSFILSSKDFALSSFQVFIVVMTRSSKKNDASNSNPYMSERMQMKLLQQELGTSVDNEDNSELPARRGRRNSKEEVGKEVEEEPPSSNSKSKPARSSRRKAASPPPTPEPEPEKLLETEDISEAVEEEDIKGPTKRGGRGGKRAASVPAAGKKGGNRTRATSAVVTEEKDADKEEDNEETVSATPSSKMDIDDASVPSPVPLPGEQNPAEQVAMDTSPDNHSDRSSKALSHNSSNSSLSKRPTIKVLDNPALKKASEVPAVKQVGNELISSSSRQPSKYIIKDPQVPSAPVDPLSAFDTWNDALQERIEKNKVFPLMKTV
jgi:hypothetical protein